MNKIFRSLLGVVLLLTLASAAFGQASITSTTLSAAVTDKAATTIVVASATGFTAGTTYVYVDEEYMNVRAVSGTTISVVRGAGSGVGGRATKHASGATVFVGPATYFTTYDRAGACTSTTELVLPVYNISTGDKYDCINGEWVTYKRNTLINAQFVDGATASATDRVFFIADATYQVMGCTQIHSVAAGGASVLQVTKDTGTNAPGAGTDILTNNTNTGFDLNATANTLQTGTLTTTAATLKLAAGNRLSVDYANTIQSSAGIVVSCTLKRQ